MTEKSENSDSKNKIEESYLVRFFMRFIISSISILFIYRFLNKKVPSLPKDISNSSCADLISQDKDLNTTSKSSIPKEFSVRELLIRSVGLIGVFFILVLYLYLVQTQYDHAEEGSWNRRFYFGLTILGAGLTWDLSKHVATLPIKNLTNFLYDLGKCIFWLALYFLFGLLAVTLNTTPVGSSLELTALTFLAALISALLCIFAGIRAIEHATAR